MSCLCLRSVCDGGRGHAGCGPGSSSTLCSQSTCYFPLSSHASALSLSLSLSLFQSASLTFSLSPLFKNVKNQQSLSPSACLSLSLCLSLTPPPSFSASLPLSLSLAHSLGVSVSLYLRQAPMLSSAPVKVLSLSDKWRRPEPLGLLVKQPVS